jgi:hypothetical protein
LVNDLDLSFLRERSGKPASPVLRDWPVSRESALHTDESNLYIRTGKEYARHDTVIHTGHGYVRREGDRLIHTNTIERVFSVFKRGMKGVYQHCGEAHLHRYLAGFDLPTTAVRLLA